MIGQAALPYMDQILAPEWRFWRGEQLRIVSMTDPEARKCNLCEWQCSCFLAANFVKLRLQSLQPRPLLHSPLREPNSGFRLSCEHYSSLGGAYNLILRAST